MVDTICCVLVLSCLFYVIHHSLEFWLIIVALKFSWRKKQEEITYFKKIFKPWCQGLYGSRTFRYYQKWSGNSHGFESQLNTMTSMVQATLPWGVGSSDPGTIFWKVWLHICPFIFSLGTDAGHNIGNKTQSLETFQLWPNKDILKLEIIA